MWNQWKPLLDHIVVFGSVAHVKILPDTRKLEKCVYTSEIVGYCEMGYVVYDFAKRAVVCTRDILIDEKWNIFDVMPNLAQDLSAKLHIEVQLNVENIENIIIIEAMMAYALHKLKYNHVMKNIKSDH